MHTEGGPLGPEHSTYHVLLLPQGRVQLQQVF